MSLPTLRVSVECGVCGESVDGDGESFSCADCGLVWPTGDPFEETPAEYADEDCPPCGHGDDFLPYVRVRPWRTVNGVVEVWRTWTVTYGPCHLPAGHKREHDWPSVTSFTEHTEEP